MDNEPDTFISLGEALPPWLKRLQETRISIHGKNKGSLDRHGGNEVRQTRCAQSVDIER